MKTILTLSMMICWMALQAQEEREIEIGKPFSYYDNEELNAALKEERIKGRKVIIDLFTSYCRSCFRLLPKVQEIQVKYSDKIKVILLGKKDRDVEKLFEHFKAKFSLSLNAIYDERFFDLYNLPAVPHYLWLDQNGVVQASTGTDELNETNFQKFITGIPFALEQPGNLHQDTGKILVVNTGSPSDSGFLYRSNLSLWSKNQFRASPVNLTSSASSFRATGVTMYDLYRYAYFGKCRWKYQDSAYRQNFYHPLLFGKFIDDTSGTFYNYSFELGRSNNERFDLQRALQNDLNTWFGFEARVTEMYVPCWNLVVLPGGKEKLKSKFEQRDLSKSTYSFLDFRHVDIIDVVGLLTMSEKRGYPIVDLTKIDFPIDIKLDAVSYDRESVKKALRLAGLDLVKGQALMKVVMIGKK